LPRLEKEVRGAAHFHPSGHIQEYRDILSRGGGILGSHSVSVHSGTAKPGDILPGGDVFPQYHAQRLMNR
jgi:hypothetical protein